MKVLITGDRNWNNYNIIKNALMTLLPSQIIEGGARGADTLARLVAESEKIPVEEIKADWEKYGKSAGPIRNKQMLDLKPDLVLAFHNNIENSKGTKNCIMQSLKLNIRVFLLKECNKSESGYTIEKISKI